MVFNCHQTITKGCTVFVRTTVNTFCCLFVLTFLVCVRFGAVRAPWFISLAVFSSMSESLTVVAPDKLEQPGFYIEKSYYFCTYLEGGGAIKVLKNTFTDVVCLPFFVVIRSIFSII